MPITAHTMSTDEIVEASVFEGPNHTMLCFDDKSGCARVTLHRVPPHVAEATAAAFNEAMAKDAS